MKLLIRFVSIVGLIYLASCAGRQPAPLVSNESPSPPAISATFIVVPHTSTLPTSHEIPDELPTSTRTESVLYPSITPSPSAPLYEPQTETITPAPQTTSSESPRFAPIDVQFIRHGSRDWPYVALTFDMCQKPEFPAGFDQAIVAALEDSNTPATFFLGGDWMRTHPEETRRLASNPLFDLGNHSWSHPDFVDLSEKKLSQEILRTQDLLYQLTGRWNRLFRLPGGTYDDLALSVIAWHGLYTIQWDVVTADPVPDNTGENIIKIVKKRVQNGSIIIMHANGRGWHTADALPGMIEYLRSEGYILVTVSQLIGLQSPPPTPTPEVD